MFVPSKENVKGGFIVVFIYLVKDQTILGSAKCLHLPVSHTLLTLKVHERNLAYSSYTKEKY